MSRNEKKRIATTGGQSLSAGGFGALDGLNASALPAAPASQPAQLKQPEPQAQANGENGAGGVRPLRHGRVDVRREKAGRGGKVVTSIGGEAFATDSVEALEALLKDLKNRFGCGGTRTGTALELQGDLVLAVMPLLEQRGYRAVRCGG